jgi:hypothetical protein
LLRLTIYNQLGSILERIQIAAIFWLWRDGAYKKFDTIILLEQAKCSIVGNDPIRNTRSLYQRRFSPYSVTDSMYWWYWMMEGAYWQCSQSARVFRQWNLRRFRFTRYWDHSS